MWTSLALDPRTRMFGHALSPGQCEQAMAHDPAAAKSWSLRAEGFAKHAHGAGVNIYITVPEVDDYAEANAQRGVKIALQPTSQLCGLRGVVLTDPDGYVLDFWTPITLSSCRSCGMPRTDARRPDVLPPRPRRARPPATLPAGLPGHRPRLLHGHGEYAAQGGRTGGARAPVEDAPWSTRRCRRPRAQRRRATKKV